MSVYGARSEIYKFYISDRSANLLAKYGAKVRLSQGNKIIEPEYLTKEIILMNLKQIVEISDIAYLDYSECKTTPNSHNRLYLEIPTELYDLLKAFALVNKKDINDIMEKILCKTLGGF